MIGDDVLSCPKAKRLRCATEICGKIRKFVLCKDRKLFQDKQLQSADSLNPTEGKSFLANIICRVLFPVLYRGDEKPWATPDIGLEAATRIARTFEQRVPAQ